MAAITLVGTAIMGVLLLVVVLALARGIDWRSNEIFAEREGSIVVALATWAIHSPVVWVLAFLGAVLGVVGLAMAIFLGIEITVLGVTIPFMELLLGSFGLLVLTYLVAGTYAAVRERNVSPAGATLVTALLLGSLMLVAIAARLLMGP